MRILRGRQNKLILATLIIILVSTSFTNFDISNAQDTMYFNILTEWIKHVDTDQTQMNLTIINHDYYDLKMTKVELNNVTLWSGNFILKGNEASVLMIDDITQALEPDQYENELDIYIEDSDRPIIEDILYLENNSTETIDEELLHSYKIIVLGHPVYLTMPRWLEEGKYFEYEEKTVNDTGTYTHMNRYNITELNNNTRIIIYNFTTTNNGETSETVVDDPGFTQLEIFLTPSQLEAIKYIPTRFNYLYSIEKEMELETPLGAYDTYQVKKAMPLPEYDVIIEGHIWVEKTSGLILKSNITYPALPGINQSRRIITRQLKETNVILEEETTTQDKGIPGFPQESIILGILILFGLLFLANTTEQIKQKLP
jgi:hypothetical protein